MAGITYSPVAGTPTRMQPTITPGIDSGSTTRRNTPNREAPRSQAACISCGSIRSSATNSGKIISGR